MRGEEVEREGYAKVMSRAGTMHVHVQTEHLEERRGRLEEEDPVQHRARACAEIEVLYVGEVLHEHVVGLELRAARGQRGKRRERGRSPRVERDARLARVRIRQRDGDGRRLGEREHPQRPLASQAQRDARPQARQIQRDGAPMPTYVRDRGHPPERRILQRVPPLGGRVAAGAGAGALEDVRACGKLLVEEEDLAEDLGWDATGGREGVAAGADRAQRAADGGHLSINEVECCRVC